MHLSTEGPVRAWGRAALLTLGVVLAVGLLLALPGRAAAQELPGTLPGPAGFSVLASGEPNALAGPFDDGGAWEVGLEGSAGNLPAATAAERAGMWFWLNGWFVRRFNYNEALAWEEDFKRAALGGTENSYLDSVDLMFYVGHGSPGQFTFDNASHDDSALSSSNDCDTSWGDRDNEWLALTSCQVLADSALGNLAQCMNKQHLILGFVTNASAHNNVGDTQAYHFSRYMRTGYNMTQSWFKACDVADRNRTVRVIAEETACFNDNPYFGSVCTDFVDNDYFWWTHACGTPEAGPVPDALLQGVDLPVLRLAPYTEADAAADLRNLGAIFSIPVTPTLMAANQVAGPQQENPPAPPPVAGSPFTVATESGQVLQLDQTSGLFEYSDLNALWSAEAADAAMAAAAAQASGAAPNAIILTPAEARRIADSFLRKYQLFSPGAAFAQVEQDYLGNGGRGSPISAAAVAQNEIPTGYSVIYERRIAFNAVTAAGEVPVDLTVVGPGAKLKVYIPYSIPDPAPGALGVDGNPIVEPLGVQGGWREQELTAASDVVEMVTTLPQATIQALYEAMESQVTLTSLPISISAQTFISSTLAYWEPGPGAPLGELIPVYALTYEITEADTGLVSQAIFHVPASPTYLRPIAEIRTVAVEAQAATALGDAVPVPPGAQVTFTAANASQTLAELGYGAQFDFVAGSQGAATTFSYNWYLGDPIEPNRIASCATTTCTITTPLTANDKGGKLVVSLIVIDEDSPNPSQTLDSRSIEVLAMGQWLPLVRKPTAQ